MAKEFEKNKRFNKSDLKQMAHAKGWTFVEKFPDGGHSELQDVGPDGTPIYYTTFNDNVSKTTRADALYDTGLLNLGIDGTGMTVGVWDAGHALKDHQEFDTRVTIADESNDVDMHATRVMGTLIASGIKKNVKGVAYGAEAITSNWSRDRIEVAQAAADGLLLSNHSYGINTGNVPDWYFGSYIRVSQDWDKIMFNAPYYLMVTAAGNAQKLQHNATPINNDPASGFDLILGFAASKNGITVAAANTEIDGKGRLLNASVAGFSSFGPVDDGRIKPDLAGNGSNILTTNATGTNGYGTYTGTSMAAPGVTGSMLLLQQYYERLYNGFMRAATLKGLVLHSADDVGQPGPDYKLGWGVMNTKKAAEIIVNKGYRTHISEETLQEGETYSITVNATGNEALVASISWTDPESEYVNKGTLNDDTPALVNDLDIRIVKNGTAYHPWKLDARATTAAATKGDNLVDPFERAELLNAVSGEYTITVTHKGALRYGAQEFSLIVSGISVTECNAEIPFETQMTEANNDMVSLRWEPITDALFEIQCKPEGSTAWETIYTEEYFINLDNLQKNTKYTVRLRTFCTENMASEYTSEMAFTFMGEDTDLEEILNYETLNTSDKT